MLRLATLVSIAAIASCWALEQPAWIQIDVTRGGEVHGTLTLPGGAQPGQLPAAFARAFGCPPARGPESSQWDTRITVHCRAPRPTALTFHAAVHLAEIAPMLHEAGVEQVNVVLTAPRTRVACVEPGGFHSEWQASYHLGRYFGGQLPSELAIDGGFEIGQARGLAAGALALILLPFLLLILRPSDALRLRAYTEVIFVFGYIGWIWVLLRFEGGALLSFAAGGRDAVPFAAMLAPPLIAVWIGSRLAAWQHARIVRDGTDPARYRTLRFWSGALATSIASVFLNVLLTPSSGLWAFPAGIVLALACVLRIRAIGRGSSHPAPQGDLRNRAFALAMKAGVRLRGVSILTSPTPRPPLALAARWGVVMLNEGLLRRLSRREVDAVICHELSHLRPVKRPAMILVYALLVASVMAAQWMPALTEAVPLALVAVYFAIKSWRRGMEYAADLDAVRWSGDPEALITGLTRVSLAHGMPLDWNAPIAWMMAHPSTMARIRLIAQSGSVSEARVSQLLEEARLPAADSYEAAPPSVPEDAAFSPALRKRLKTRLTAFLLVSPIAIGFPVSWLLQRAGLGWWAVLIAGTVLSALVMNYATDWLASSVRSIVKRRAVARYGSGVFAGISLGAEPRLFDGFYHYDLGLVRFTGDALEFAGDRARFTLGRWMVQRVWLGAGPRHWTPRKLVFIECRPVPDRTVIFSLQSLEARFWPGTISAANRLHERIDRWVREKSVEPAAPLPCDLPAVEGVPSNGISPQTAVRSIAIYSGIAFLLATLTNISASMDFSGAFCAMAVCGFLALFLVWPNLRLGPRRAG